MKNRKEGGIFIPRPVPRRKKKKYSISCGRNGNNISLCNGYISFRKLHQIICWHTSPSHKASKPPLCLQRLCVDAITPIHDITSFFSPNTYPSNTPLSFKLRNSSGSRNLLMVTSSARPFLLRVLSTKSRASCCAVAGSSGRVVMSLSRGSPGTMDQRSKTRERETWPCVWICGKLVHVQSEDWNLEMCTYP